MNQGAPKIVEIVRKLAARTANDNQPWEETSEKNQFQATFPGFSVVISERDSPFGGTHIVRVYDDRGNLLEAAGLSDLKRWIDNADSVVSKMFEGARRKALGVDAALDKLLELIPAEDDDIPF